MLSVEATLIKILVSFNFISECDSGQIIILETLSVFIYKIESILCLAQEATGAIIVLTYISYMELYVPLMAWDLSSSHRLQTAKMKPQGTQRRESGETEFLGPMSCAGELRSGFQGFMNDRICIYIQDCLPCLFLKHNSVVIYGRWVKRMGIFQVAELDCPPKHHL